MNIRSSTLIIILSIATFASHSLLGQSSPQAQLYDWFDTSTGKNNLLIINGVLHHNPHKIINTEKHMYFLSDDFSKGNILYDGQPYYNVNLKYDVYNDVVVLKPEGNSDLIAVTIIPEKTKAFLFKNRNFINLSYDKSISQPDFIKGYYEVNLVGKEFTFYIKYHKKMTERIHSDALYSDFEDKNSFFIKYQNTFYEINSQNDLATLFPKYKSQITEFYSSNGKLKRENETRFMENLMKFINTLFLL